jgi:hypothetical protein
LCAGILQPPTSSVTSMNLPASLPLCSAVHQSQVVGGATVTSVGGSATGATLAAPAPRVVRRLAGLRRLPAGVCRLRLELEAAAAAALRVDMAGVRLGGAKPLRSDGRRS